MLLATILSFIFFSQVTLSGPAQAPPRDRVQPPRTGTGVVKGRVVDGTTGGAIARARVVMQGGPGGAPVVTDGEGSFTFTGLPAGPVMLMAQKSTYLPARYPTSGRTIRSQMRPLILRDGQVLDNVVVPMFHGGSIAGRVFDANGDPLDYAQVSLLRLPSGGRAGKPVMRESTQTNDLGEFRLGRLEAGTYLVQVAARRENEMMTFAPGGTPQPPPQLTPQLVPTFYPGALAMDQAQPITVEKGQAVAGIDVVLAEGVPGVVTGVVLTAAGEQPPPNSFPNVMIRRVMSDKVPGLYDYSMSNATARPDGTFRAVLPPGEYMLEARLAGRMSPSIPQDEQIAMARVTVVSGGEEALTMTLGSGASATGRVVFEGNTPAPPSPGRIRVPMFGDGGMCRSGEAEIAPDWSFRIRGLSGTCSAEPRGLFGRWVLKGVIINGENALDAPVTFQPGQQFRDVQVVVTDRQSAMVFQVSDENGQTTRDYVLVAYPVEKERWTTGARVYTPPPISIPSAAAEYPGAASMPPMRPQSLPAIRSGDYYVVAVDDMEPDDFRDPAVLDRLRSSATRVTVPEGGTVQVSVRRVNFATAVRPQ